MRAAALRRPVADLPQHWYAVRVSQAYLTLTRRGPSDDPVYVRRAVERLARLGCNPFVPTEARWQRRSRYSMRKDRKRVTRPLMPGYVLIAPPEPVDWPTILGLDFVHDVICIDGAPARIAAEDPRDRDLPAAPAGGLPRLPRGLTWIFARHTEVADQRQIDMPTNRAYAVGDRVVRIDGDAWEGRELRVAALNDDGTVEVEVELFGAPHRATTAAANLAKAE